MNPVRSFASRWRLLVGVSVVAALTAAVIGFLPTSTSASPGPALQDQPSFVAQLRVDIAGSPTTRVTFDYRGVLDWTWTEEAEGGESRWQEFDGGEGTFATWNSGRDTVITDDVGSDVFVPPSDWFVDRVNLLARGYEEIGNNQYRKVFDIRCEWQGLDGPEPNPDPACAGRESLPIEQVITMDPAIGLPSEVLEILDDHVIASTTLEGFQR